MPIYEYKCSECGARFEKLVSGSGEKEILCDICGSKKLERILSLFAFSGKDKSGTTTKSSTSSCSSCTSSSCSTCH